MTTTQDSIASKAKEVARAAMRPRFVRYGLSTVVALLLLFGLLGYFWLPGFAKAKLEALLSDEFGRPVHVERIEVSPYTLSAAINGFSISQANGTEAPLFGFDRLYVDISSLSLARGIPVVSEVRLSGLKLHLIREASGRYNISDLLDKWLAGPPEPSTPPSPTPEFSVSNITLEGGSVVFEDQLQKGRQEVTEINLGIPFVANTSGAVQSDVLPSFAAKVNGAPIALTGKLRPFAPGKDAAVEFKINDFDLMRVFHYAPPDMPAQLESAKLDTDLMVEFVQEGKDSRVRVRGVATLREIALIRAQPGGPRLRLTVGKTSLKLDEATLAGLVRAKFGVTDLALAKAGDKQPFLGFAELDVNGISVSKSERQATVDEVRLSKPFGVARRLANGTLDIQAAIAAPGAPAKTPGKAVAKQASKPAQNAKAAASPAAWKWQVKRIAVADGTLRYSDETLPKVRPLVAADLALGLDGLASGAGQTAKLDFSTRINEHGSVKIAGTVQPEPVRADLDLGLSQVDLVALQGWFTGDLNAVLTRGDVSVKGNLKVGDPDTSFTGEVALIDLNVLDKVNSTDLLRWRSLKLSGLSAGTSPLRFGVDEVALSSFFARLLLTPEGRLNLQDVVRKEPPAKQDQPGKGDKPAQAEKTEPSAKSAKPSPNMTVAGAAPPAAKTETGSQQPGPQIRIGRIVLSGGNINFTDRFIKPNYTANLTDLSGRIGKLSAGTPTEVAIKGKIDRTAPLEISGKMDPLSKPLSLDIQAKAKGIEMSTFSPYSGRHIGYAIQKGKLSVDVHYMVEKDALKAENNIFLDQLTIGDKVDSPDAMSIPINLVLALLKNSKGEIDINLPIQGSLNDPQFSLGGVIAKVILNLIVKAATSPFTLLASMFGGGEELSYITFEPGQSTLPPAAEKSLQTLAKALSEREALKIEVTGVADPALEQEGLKRAILDRRVRSAKATEMARRGKASGGLSDVTVTEEEYPRYLERVYKAADIKKPRNLIGMAKGLPPEQMEALLLSNIQATPDDLTRLAKDRGVAVQAWLVEKGGIDQGRVFLLAPKTGGAAPKGVPAGGRVDFTLR
ncbi:MAG: DUF748 domain-containing protein [Humidesulfovibrio sp.]|uniref:DUF748 domain-containing protein n=1 Tax=Humidesulfovibrio sp. TaxID=2910988 RepID=UPI00280027F9|nr:DUF748 domain-containing protein [Humidesulfovibrio sp.]MDQ7834218.1 DUF748 domain-containing protein [Humidesulfovibrio sp.]